MGAPRVGASRVGSRRRAELAQPAEKWGADGRLKAMTGVWAGLGCEWAGPRVERWLRSSPGPAQGFCCWWWSRQAFGAECIFPASPVQALPPGHLRWLQSLRSYERLGDTQYHWEPMVSFPENQGTLLPALTQHRVTQRPRPC